MDTPISVKFLRGSAAARAIGAEGPLPPCSAKLTLELAAIRQQNRALKLTGKPLSRK